MPAYDNHITSLSVINTLVAGFTFTVFVSNPRNVSCNSCGVTPELVAGFAVTTVLIAVLATILPLIIMWKLAQASLDPIAFPNDPAAGPRTVPGHRDYSLPAPQPKPPNIDVERQEVAWRSVLRDGDGFPQGLVSPAWIAHFSLILTAIAALLFATTTVLLAVLSFGWDSGIAIVAYIFVIIVGSLIVILFFVYLACWKR